MEEKRVLRVTWKCQLRLDINPYPHKRRKALQKLSALPMTPHILRETGIRKTVKGLRKHALLGPLARDLAARWKRLARPGPEAQSGRQALARHPQGEPAGLQHAPSLRPQAAQGARRPLDVERASFSPPEGMALSCPGAEGDEAAPGGARVHSKTPVYSGHRLGRHSLQDSRRPAQCTEPPSSPTREEQEDEEESCSTLEASGIGRNPVGWPCADQHTPTQLRALEKSHKELLAERRGSRRLHCHGALKEEKPQGPETWRHRDPRLQEAPEQGLPALTRSTHDAAEAQRPRSLPTQTILANGGTRPPGGSLLPQRQEHCATGASSCGSGSGPDSGNKPASACPLASSRAPWGPAPKGGRLKTEKVAPLMAKTIRDYKKMCSRR